MKAYLGNIGCRYSKDYPLTYARLGAQMGNVVVLIGFEDYEILDWLQSGQIPLSHLWSAFTHPNTTLDWKKAYMHAALKTIRHTLKSKK